MNASGKDEQRASMAERLRQAREYVGLSQEEVATALGISRPAVTNIESCSRKVEATELNTLARMYRRTLEYLLTLQTTGTKFDLVLSYPQWQGSGRSENLRRGAQAAAEVCRQYGTLVQVPDAGEGEVQGGINRWTAILEQFCSAQKILEENRPRRILTAGGDCACDIAIIDYLHRQYPDLTVIWVDAHLDANTVETSPSGNLHGMPVAAIMGSAPAELRPLLSTPLPPAQFRYVSAHLGDDGDWAFQREHGLSWHEAGQPLSGPIHVHFDLDALDPAEFPHLAYPDGKLSMDAGLDLMRTIAATGTLVGLTITEFAPADQRGADEGSRFLAQLCEAARAR